MTATTRTSRATPRTWGRELALGARFATGGGTEGWTRTALTAVGVALGVMLLLVAAAVPAMVDNRSDRSYAREAPYSPELTRPTAGTMLVKDANTTFRQDRISGSLLQPEGPNAPVPPGVDRLPRPNEMVASPALAKLLNAPDSELLRQRLPYRIIGTIGDQGLDGPGDLSYYAGTKSLSGRADGGFRIDHFGLKRKSTPLDPILMLLVVMIFVVLLMPVMVFIGTAVRFGGERRDRRLAALRLVGADVPMARRIAAGEALFGSLIGLVVGAGFFLAVRQFVGSFSMMGIGVFPSDVTPSAALVALIALAVPGAAVGVTLLALRGVTIEPLGVVRAATPRPRRLWWRLVLPVLGIALLFPLIGRVGTHGSINQYQIAAGVVLLLVGLALLLPWLVESAVRRLRGGPLPWQLATRRLQLSSGMAARMVSGITVAVAGAIALQTLFAGAEHYFTSSTGQDPNRAQIMARVQVHDGTQAQQAITTFRTTQGVRSAFGVTEATAAGDSGNDRRVPVTVADCTTLREIARIDGCSPNSVFVIKGSDNNPSAPYAMPGKRLDLNAPYIGAPTGGPRPWTIPADARIVQPREDAAGMAHYGVLATPGALSVSELAHPVATVAMKLDPTDPDAADRVRNTGSRLDPSDPTMTLTSTAQDHTFSSIRRGLLVGATATLLVIGASMLVSTLEQLRERRRLLAVLVAFGTRRGTLALSVLWQAAVPVVIGLGLALVGGLGLGTVLLKMVKAPVRFDWAGVAGLTGAGAAVVLLVTVLSLPPLWRMMRPEGLRTE
ncbi:FtsX-like permease family protein [Streptantibioticus ferralitis]|uniref:ABC transporter permease n=1 Tax=Streptantibioticus ferralitis TaxID=236510 RepID=A0ABT5Z9N9_9ACTN|nr:FtsX-like permease family protein [Streptantibioticus ferralitis]MDF2260549.1 ABC transporter permease [Streptantibioticus ferralitis]